MSKKSWKSIRRDYRPQRVAPRDVLDGATCVRFGPFEAMTSAATLVDTNTKAVWKVWCCPADDDMQKLIVADQPRKVAVAMASTLAAEWRLAGKPDPLKWSDDFGIACMKGMKGLK